MHTSAASTPIERHGCQADSVSDGECWWLGMFQSRKQARHRKWPELQNHTFQMHPRWVLYQAPDLSAAFVPVLPGAGVLKTRSLSTAIQREIFELLDLQSTDLFYIRGSSGYVVQPDYAQM